MKLVAAILSALALASCAHARAAAPVAKTDEACDMHSTDAAGAKVAFDHPPKVGEKATCPVSGDSFFVDADTITTEYDGKWYAFCCGDCPADFKKDPAKYAK